MKKPLLILAISASFIAGTMVGGNFVFADDTDGQNGLLDHILSANQSQEPVCPAENVQYWHGVSFVPENNRRLVHNDLVELNDGTESLIMIHSDSDEIIDIEQKIVQQLTDKGYLVVVQFNPPVSITKDDIKQTLPIFEELGVFNFMGNFGNVLLKNTKV